jgi:diacylglycerol kinase family enzyme
MTRRLAAIAALLLMAASLILAVVVAVQDFPAGISVLVCLLLAVLAAWWGVVRRGLGRVVGVGVGVLLLAGSVALVVLEGRLLENGLILVGLALSVVAARTAFTARVRWPAAPRPERPVLFFNPKSGGGKAKRFNLSGEARARGIEPIELRPGDDLERLVRDATARGADALAMAGGDGSQAIVAAIAAEQDVPYACIPAGTRNHFALDLGVDRDDVVGALDALVDGGERTVDLAEVNGRVFVNNVSLGVYAEAVQREGYRNAKLRTLANTAPELLGPGGEGLDLRWSGPDGRDRRSAAVILVSNDRYRLGRALGTGTRPRLDAGCLGIAVIGARTEGRHGANEGLQDWSAPSFELRSEHPIAVGIDGEAGRLDPPLRFRTRPAALRVRIAFEHPGASPSAMLPEHPGDAIRALARAAAGRS